MDVTQALAPGGPAGRPPRVSVLLPVFDAAPYLDDAVRSVLEQTYTDFELIAIDDGSRDASWRILSARQASDPRMRIVQRENRGLVATLNELLGMARGEFVARMDADDCCLPHRLERQVDYLDRHPQVVALGSRAEFIDPEGLPITDFVEPLSHAQIERALLKPQIGILHPTVTMRRSALEKAGPYRSDFAHVEDLLFLRLAEVGELANLPDVLLRYRVHVHSVSHRHAEAQARAGRAAVAAALVRRGVAPAVPVAQPPAASPGDRSPAERPTANAVAASPGKLHRKWSWWALGAGHLRTARKHALLAFAAEPWSRENPRLVACVVRDSLARMR